MENRVANSLSLMLLRCLSSVFTSVSLRSPKVPPLSFLRMDSISPPMADPAAPVTSQITFPATSARPASWSPAIPPSFSPNKPPKRLPMPPSAPPNNPPTRLTTSPTGIFPKSSGSIGAA
ncbi:hypothetical protein B0H11DRAFT_2029222 [Mycena galericulata]|nr:hypothetical protein B0H11DRAFT_2029222 [Mycena galericulata]